MASATATTRTPRREATRARLLTAAAGAFAERGFYGTSVEDICERAGFTRGAFYSNFESREEIVLALYEQRSATLRSRIEELTAPDRETTPAEIMRAVIDLWDDADARHQWHLLQTELMLHAARDPQAGAAWAAHLSRSQADIGAVLRAYVERTGIALPIDVADLSRLLHSTFLGGAIQHLIDPQAVGRDQLETAFMTLVEHAITPAP